MAQMTKRALADSLKNILLTKPITRVTINDITENCGVSRMTFYYHFKDIYDLAEWIMEETIAEALAAKADDEPWQTCILRIFRLFQEDRPFIMNVYHHVSRERIEGYLYDIVFELSIAMVEERAKGMDLLDRDKRFIADFYKYALTGIVLNWVKDGMKEDPAQIVNELGTMVGGTIDYALESFQVDDRSLPEESAL